MEEKWIKILKNTDFNIWDIYKENTETLTLTIENNRIDKIVNGKLSGFGIRGVKNFNTFYGWTNESEKVLYIIENIISSSKYKEKDIKIESKKPLFTNKIIIPPESVDFKKKVEILKGINEFARTYSDKLLQFKATYIEKIQKIEIINDMGNLIEEKRIYTTIVFLVVVGENNKIETFYDVISGYKGYEIIDEKLIFKKIKDAIDSALILLGTDKKINGKMSVVISGEAGGTFIHEAIGHSLEADEVQKGLSPYKNKLGKKIANSKITVIDDATIPNNRGSFSFDDEGIPSQRTILIENGILKNYLYDRKTAFFDKTSSTGNGRRESFMHQPIPRMSNTIIDKGSDKKEDIIKDTKKGLYVVKMGGGEVNTITGDFVFEVKKGYMIENGKITYPVRDATLIGRGDIVLNNIDAVSDDLGFEVGTCGKMGQGVPVSDGQPTIRILEMLIGNK